jgi:hypothetical protein
MDTRLQDLIDAAQRLSPLEKLDLISAVSRSLQQAYAKAEGAAFWEPKSLNEHVRLQEPPVVEDIAETA